MTRTASRGSTLACPGVCPDLEPNWPLGNKTIPISAGHAPWDRWTGAQFGVKHKPNHGRGMQNPGLCGFIYSANGPEHVCQPKASEPNMCGWVVVWMGGSLYFMRETSFYSSIACLPGTRRRSHFAPSFSPQTALCPTAGMTRTSPTMPPSSGGCRRHSPWSVSDERCSLPDCLGMFQLCYANILNI